MAMGTPNTSPASQQQAMDRMAMGEEPIRAYDGTNVNLSGYEPVGNSRLASSFLRGRNQDDTTNYINKYRFLKDQMGGGPSGSMDDYINRRLGLIKGSDFDTSDAYEMNPYIAGLQLAAAVANAPKGQLISSVLNPESIQQMTDPIQEMAKAKAADKREEAQARMQAQFGGLEAFETAERAGMAQDQEMLGKIFDQVTKEPNKQLVESGGSYYIVNTDTNEVTNLEGIPVKPDFTPINVGDGRLAVFDNTKGKFTFSGEKDPTSPYSFMEFGETLLRTNETTGEVTPMSVNKGKQIFGNVKDGFVEYDPDAKTEEGKFTTVLKGTADNRPELQQNIEAMNQTLVELEREDLSEEEKLELTNSLDVYRSALGLKDEDTEFERILNEAVGNIEELNIDGKGKQDAIDFKAKVLKDYLINKTTKPMNYNPREALDKEFAVLYKDIFQVQDKALKGSSDLLTLGNRAGKASDALTEKGVTTGVLTGAEVWSRKLFSQLPFLANVSEESYLGQFLKGNKETISNIELLEQAGAEFAVQMADNFPGNLNQSEINLIIASGPSIFTSPQGLKNLQKILQSSHDRNIREAKMVDDYLLSEEGQAMTNANAQEQYNALRTKLREFRNSDEELRIENSLLDEVTKGNEEAQKVLAPNYIIDGQEVNLSSNDIKLLEVVQQFKDAEGGSTNSDFLKAFATTIMNDPDLKKQYLDEETGDLKISTDFLSDTFNNFSGAKRINQE